MIIKTQQPMTGIAFVNACATSVYLLNDPSLDPDRI